MREGAPIVTSILTIPPPPAPAPNSFTRLKQFRDLTPVRRRREAAPGCWGPSLERTLQATRRDPRAPAQVRQRPASPQVLAGAAAGAPAPPPGALARGAGPLPGRRPDVEAGAAVDPVTAARPEAAGTAGSPPRLTLPPGDMPPRPPRPRPPAAQFRLRPDRV